MARADRNQPLLPAVSVKLNGQALAFEVAAWIVSVTVEDDLDVPGMFAIELISREDADGTMPWTDDERFALGAAVEVSMGYGDDVEALISGEITALEPTFCVEVPPTLVVRGYDKRHRLNAARRARSYVEQKDSDIASQIGSEAGLTVQAEDSSVTHPYVLQANQTDFEFLLERARRIEYELAMDGDTLLFRPVANADADEITLTLLDDLLEFRPRLALVPVTEFDVLGWDPKEKQAITASAAAGDEVGTMDGAESAAQQASDFIGDAVEGVARAAVASQAEADQLAGARLNAAALDFVCGDGRARGRTDVRAGKVIRLDQLGTRFSGQYYVTSAVHRYTRRDGYVTDFSVRRNSS